MSHRVRPSFLAGLVVAMLMPATIGAQAPAKPVRQAAFPLSGFPRSSTWLPSYSPNTTDCSLSAPGGIGENPTSSVFGCVWPAGTSNNYVFNSGLQFAGIVGPDGGPWAGDTSGAFIFDMKGTTENGTVLGAIFDSRDSNDVRRWPPSGRVPGGMEGAIFHPGLRGQLRASDRDVWWLSWEGQASLQNGRRHPLGVVFETRGLGWNDPVGNESILYWVFTLYNVTSSDPAAYAALRPEIQSVLVRQALEFRRQASGAFGVTLPAVGYTITGLHTALAADFDVGNAGANFSSINVPLSLGFSWQHDFARETYWRFDPRVFGAPLFSGTGFVGTKVLLAPQGGTDNRSFVTPTGGGAFGSPRDVFQLYRYLSGSFSGPAGDPPCNFSATNTRICFINTGVPSDTRSMLTAGPGTLAPGGSLSFVVAYIFSAPAGQCAAPCFVSPGNPLAINDAAGLLSTGYAGFTDWNGDGEVQGDEFATVPRSLLAKAQLAQAFFDSGFLTPAAPEAPDFFLIPGSSSVTVLWRPSATESSGDPYFAVAGDPLRLGTGASAAPNALFDPNYRQFDVEGYRIYRGRTDRPDEFTLLAEFDYQGTVISDFTGQVQPTALCAPELALLSGCPVAFDPPVPGQAPQARVDVPLAGPVVQVRAGDRILLTDGSSLILRADTVGAYLGASCLCDTGVPFIYRDSTVGNSFRYFYSVTAFDLNSWQSGPSSLESPRIVKAVTPSSPASNTTITGSVEVAVYGRGVRMDSVISADPVLDATTGRFSGSARPADGLTTALLGALVPEAFAATGSVRIRLDSVQMGEADPAGCCSLVDPGDPTLRYFTIVTDTDTLSVSLSASSAFNQEVRARSEYDAAHPDSVATARYGVPANVAIRASLEERVPPVVLTAAWGLGCSTQSFGLFPPNPTSVCSFNGARWFDGPSLPGDLSRSRNETASNPTGANCRVSGIAPLCSAPGLYANAGEVTVNGTAQAVTVYVPQSYTQINRRWRNFEFDLGTVTRAADFNVYWAAAGRIDSVIDASHNVPVRFSTRAGSTWGILNADNPGLAASHDARPELTVADLGCVEPLRSLGGPAIIYPCATTAQFEGVARLGPLALFQDADTLDRVAPIRASPGFLLYIAGVPTFFELTTLPAAGSVWTLRNYSGVVWGGQGAGAGGTPEPYQFTAGVRPFTAEGAELRLTFQVTNRLSLPANRDLRQVHTVPDPFYLRSGYDENQSLRFVNLPDRAIIRIYSSSGILVRVLEHHSAALASEELWDLTNRIGQRVASGVYFYHIESSAARKLGRLTVVNYAQ